jgi:hypothetical protein
MDLPEGRTIRRGSLGGDGDLSGDFEQWYLHQFNAPEEGEDTLARTSSALKLVATDGPGPRGRCYSLETVVNSVQVDVNDAVVEEESYQSVVDAANESAEKNQMVAEIMELVAAGAIEKEKGDELLARLDVSDTVSEPLTVTPKKEAPPSTKEKKEKRLSVYSQFVHSGQMPVDGLAFEELVLKQARMLCETSEREEILQGEVSIKAEKLQMAGEMLQVLQEQGKEANEQMDLLEDECESLATSLLQAEQGQDDALGIVKQLEEERAVTGHQHRDNAARIAQLEARLLETEEKYEELAGQTNKLQGTGMDFLSVLRVSCHAPLLLLYK